MAINKFLPLKKFLNEGSDDPRMGCVMLFADIPDWNKLTHRIVREEDIYDPTDEPGEYGYEESPHITVIYGIHHDEVLDDSIIYRKIQQIPIIKTTIKEIGVFENADKPYDVVKFDINPTKTLLDARQEFLELPNTQSFPEYHPHMTIAYVRAGEGRKYRKLLKTPIKISFKKGVYSDPDYRKSYFDLKTLKYKK